MPTLTSTATLAITDVAVVEETADIFVLPVAGEGDGTGRLWHPVLGGFSYTYPPDEWTNFRGDVVVPPVWSFTPTLTSVAATLWAGSIRDVEVEERWIDADAMDVGMLDSLLSFWTTPCDPEDEQIQWWPSYVSDLGFYVAIVGVTVGGNELVLTPTTMLDIVEGPVALRLRILGRVPA